MRSGVHNSYFINKRKAFGRIWSEFSCSRILDEFGCSPHNFRFQAFEVASSSNVIKAHFCIRQQTQGYYGDVNTTGWKSAITWWYSPSQAATVSYHFPQQCKQPHQKPSIRSQRCSTALSPTICKTDSPIAQRPAERLLQAQEWTIFRCFCTRNYFI